MGVQCLFNKDRERYDLLKPNKTGHPAQTVSEVEGDIVAIDVIHQGREATAQDITV